MLQLKNAFHSHRVRVTLALTVIAIAVVLSFLSPIKEQDPNIGLINDPATATAVMTNPVAALTLSRGADFREIHLTVTKVEEAGAFSDDNKRNGLYTVRVQVHVQPAVTMQSPAGYDYASLARLVLPGGQTVAPKLLSLLAVVLPNQPEDGFIDFPVMTRLPLSSLALRLGNNTLVAFG